MTQTPGLADPAHPTLADPSLFIYHSPHGILVLLLYVDDMLLTGSSPSFLNLHREFAIKELGSIHHFLGMKISPNSDGLHVSQTLYALTLLDRTYIIDSKPMSTPLETKFNNTTDDTPLADPSFYSSIVRALQYLTLTRPDLAFSVNLASQFMQAPCNSHLKMVRCILRYVKGTLSFGLQFFSRSILDLFAFSDADWARCPTTRRSTTGYCTFLGQNLLSWRAKK
ncbi:uncharacterized protein LOC111388158 [Olea europaea var. sylvestris]|uniref:uncharacterized protein LOC111388158 n=1 Tax=Olea europaea var. sylvestris TaxID=158386 RepID=UPI000C1D396A|nr:uncharacterized protein LOC111388158 [Olea europaea var. sylvestris]